MKLPSRCGIVFAVALVVNGCGVTTENQPRDIPSGERQNLALSIATPSGATIGAEQIYLVTAASATKPVLLRAVSGNFGTEPTQLLSALLKGPSQQNIDDQLITLIPNGTILRSAKRESGSIVVVDLTEQMLELPITSVSPAVAQIVFTAFQAPDVSGVLVTINGESRDWIIGDGTTVTRAMTTFDFPGLVETSQPDFPSLPVE